METKIAVQFQPFAEKMEKSGLAPTVIDIFRHYYGLLVRGETGLITKGDIDPVREGEIADAEKLTGL
ncbi:MAG: hypothetical protein JRJ79_11085, partial [Deltaproteobacteria bacterium]|nr:hypothetical protein [Deltaproteobacteria bacterium]